MSDTQPVRHTFLLDEGEWDAHGHYWSDLGVEFVVEGHTSITHGRMHWASDGFMRLVLPDPVEFRNRYEIEPFQPGVDWTSWVSHDPAVGTLRGTFMLVDDCILSSYSSDDGCHTGTEAIVRVEECLYHARGFAFASGRKLSSWSVVLHRSA